MQRRDITFVWTPCLCQFVYLSHQDSLLKQKSELKSLSLCKKMCCCVYDCLLHTDSNPRVARGRLLAKKPLKFILKKNFCSKTNFVYSPTCLNPFILRYETLSLPSFHGCVLIRPNLCSFANCTHVLHNISTQSHAQAPRADDGQAGHGQLPRNPSNLLLRPPVSALG